MQYEKVAILGATGPAGLYIARLLRSRGVALRAVARTASKLEHMFRGPSVERCAADVTKVEDARRALDGCELAFHCIGLPADEMHMHRAAAHGVAAAMQSCGTRCVHVSSYWSYLPLVGLPLNEDHPRQDGSPWMQHRRAAEDTLLDAGAAIANLPDFYGPGVHTSTLQQALVNAAHNRTIYWLGATGTEREYCYLADAAATVIRLSEADEAYGQHWLIPTDGPLSATTIAENASAVRGSKIKVRAAGLKTLRLFSLVNPPLRRFLQIVPEYVKPIRYDTAKIENLLGPQPVTSYAAGIRQTIEWLVAEADAN